MQLPSASNTTGTLLGTLAGGLAASQLAAAPFIATAAVFLGMNPVGLAGAIGIGVTALVNYGVTHYSEVKNLNGLVQTWWPQIQYTYPADKVTGITSGNG